MMSSTKPKVHPHFAANDKLIQRLHSSVCPCCVPMHRPIQFAISRVLGLLGTCFPPKLLIPLRGIVTSMFHEPSPFIIPNGILKGSAVFVWVPNSMLYNALLKGKKTQKIAPFPLIFCHSAGGEPSHGDRQHARKV